MSTDQDGGRIGRDMTESDWWDESGELPAQQTD